MLLDWIIRQRSSRGFGIHSPFAYDFVVNVLRERCLYYAYDHIIDKDPRLLYRISLSLHPSSVNAGSLSKEETDAVQIDSLRDSEFPMYILSSGHESVSIHSDQFVAVLFDLHDKKVLMKYCEILDSMHGYGMTFSNPHKAVVVADRKLPRQDFRINF